MAIPKIAIIVDWLSIKYNKQQMKFDLVFSQSCNNQFKSVLFKQYFSSI